MLIQGLEPQDWTWQLSPRVEGGRVGIAAVIIPTSSLQQPGDAFHSVKVKEETKRRKGMVAPVAATRPIAAAKDQCASASLGATFFVAAERVRASNPTARA